MRVFIDLDGVLADWEYRVSSLFGKNHKEVKPHILWQFIGESDNFWIGIPKTRDFDKLVNLVKEYNPTVLSGCPKSSYDKTEKQKLSWCDENLTGWKVITCLAKDKQKHLVEEGDILIDDNEDNCKRWRDAGGIAIFHKNFVDTEKEFLELKEKAS